MVLTVACPCDDAKLVYMLRGGDFPTFGDFMNQDALMSFSRSLEGAP